MLTNTRKLQISAAVMLVLAGCGGGSSSGVTDPLAGNPNGPSANAGSTLQQPGAQTPAPEQPSTPQVPESPKPDTSAQQPASPAQPQAPDSKPAQPDTQNGKPAQPEADSHTGNGESSSNGSNGNATGHDTAPAAPVRPIDAKGINGAVLATMLDQHSVDPGHEEGSIAASRAYPSTVEGAFLSNPVLPIVQSVQFRDVPYNGEGYRPGAPGSYSPVDGAFVYTAFNGTAYDASGTVNTSVNSIGMDVHVTRTADAVSLSPELIVRDENGENYQEGPHYRGEGYRIGSSERIRYNQVLTEWKHGQHSVQLIISPVTEDQAALCWNYQLPNTSRLYCNKWKLPENWQAGQPLTYAGHYLVESRQGEKVYWHTKPQVSR